MDPRSFTWDRLIWMNRQWKGIVITDFRDENAPHFILNLVEELKRENVTESIAPCQTFAKSFMMVSPATKRRDLVLLLRPLNETSMSRLELWRGNQGEQIVMMLSDYVKQYAAEFTGITPAVKTNDNFSDNSPDNSGNSKADQEPNKPPRKGKKDRRKRNRPESPEEDNNESGNEGNPEGNPEEENTGDDGSDVPGDGEENQ